MSDIQRYAVRKDALIREVEEFPPAFPHDYMEVVYLAADAESAIAAAEQRVVDQMNASHPDEFMWEAAQRDMLARCIAAVEACEDSPASHFKKRINLPDALAALHALADSDDTTRGA